MKHLASLSIVVLLFSCGQKEKPSAIQQERARMHQDFEAALKYDKVEEKLKNLSRKLINQCTPRQAEKRIRYEWRLGKVQQLKTDIPTYLNSKALNGLGYGRSDWRLVVHMWEHAPSEWARYVEMIDELYKHFKATGNVRAEQQMLGAKIQGAHLMGDTLNERKLLLQMLHEIGPNDERYETYYIKLGWWYQDHGSWEKSIPIFQKRYRVTKYNSPRK